MLILLPPSEGKAVVGTGDPVQLGALSFPELTKRRESLMTAVEKLANGRATTARRVLGLSPRQDAELERDRSLRTAPAAPAVEVYTGVLYEALAYGSLPAAARRRLDRWVVVSSALWGAVRLTDRVPAYRLSADVTLPRLGKVATGWRKPLARVMPAEAGDKVVLDLRSGPYAAMWTPTGDLAEQTLVARVLQRRADGSVSVVSHHNKATKGRLVAQLARTGVAPNSPKALAEALSSHGAEVDLAEPGAGRPGRLDIVVHDL
ncbi:MAG: peroxide stress protein YaaA [Actinomycetes bacterium]